MSFRPVWFEANRFFEFLGGLVSSPLYFRASAEIVMSVGVVGFEFESFAIVGDGSVPRLRTREFDGLFAIGFGGLGEARSWRGARTDATRTTVRLPK